MDCEKADQNSNSFVPWDRDTRRVVEYVQDQIPCTRLLIGVINPGGPQPDELMAVHGWSEQDLRDWLSGGHRGDHLLKAAVKHSLEPMPPGHGGNGAASAILDAPTDESTPLAPNTFATAHVLAEAHVGHVRRWWLMILAREERPFEPNEKLMADLMLRRWQCTFSHVDETGMRRLIYGHDDRLLISDLDTQTTILHHPSFPDELFAMAMPIVNQRWPNLADNSTCDVVVELEGKRSWVCVRRSRMMDMEESRRSLVIARPLDQDDLPAVSVVDDDRIARAIAHIHDNFQESPSLAQIARQVHISPFHFHRLFTKQVGVSPKQYLQRKQLQIARWLLRSTRLPISTIARQSGFASHGHFTSTFHRAVGKSPREYREAEVAA